MKQFKSILSLISAIIMSLIVPLFGRWYEQTTGIKPDVFYGLCLVGVMFMLTVINFKIWNDDI